MLWTYHYLFKRCIFKYFLSQPWGFNGFISCCRIEQLITIFWILKDKFPLLNKQLVSIIVFVRNGETFLLQLLFHMEV